MSNWIPFSVSIYHAPVLGFPGEITEARYFNRRPENPSTVKPYLQAVCQTALFLFFFLVNVYLRFTI